MNSFETDRANRKAAWALFEKRLSTVQEDLAARSIGGRITDKVTQDALDLVDEAVAVAKDNKGLIAATLAALLAWVFRVPLIGWIDARFGGQASVQAEPANDQAEDQSREPSS